MAVILYTKMDLRNVFTTATNRASMYVILRLKTTEGTSYHYIPRDGREAFQEYYEQHFWVTSESNGKLIDIREGKDTEITGMTHGGPTAINTIW